MELKVFRKVIKSLFICAFGRGIQPHRVWRGLASGYKMCVSPNEHLGYLFGTVETYLQKLIEDQVHEGDVVYDIGANIGYVSLGLAKQVGPRGKVIAFEPVPENIARLRKNIQINGLRNVRVLEYAVSDNRFQSTIRILENLSTASLVWHRTDPTASEIVVETISIDELVESGHIETPTFVKIDVEGAEGQVLAGMRKTLVGAHPVLFLECSDAGREKTWDLLRQLGYKCHSAITGKRIDEFGDYRHSDFTWLPPRSPN
jgi:FkbM family methyltransferase